MPFGDEGEPITSAKIRACGSISESLKKLIRIGEIKVAMNDDHKQVYVRSKYLKDRLKASWTRWMLIRIERLNVLEKPLARSQKFTP